MEPAREVGGDFFDIINLENDRVGLAIADVSDKGVPAALFMMSSRTLLKGAAIGKSNPGDVLTEVNYLLEEDNDAAMFVTVFYAEYNPENRLLSYANGGHNPPIVVHADGSSTVLPQTNGIALGILPDIQYEQNAVILAPGDVLVLYTDGVTEAVNAQNEEFEMERLCAVLAEAHSHDVREMNEAVFQAVQAFAGEMPQFDDMTCMTLFCKEIET
jgi:sigma-B regulation protein RsbU (phosphoserine phosphatase)